MLTKILADTLRAQFPGVSGDIETLAQIAQALHLEIPSTLSTTDAAIFEALGMPANCNLDYLQAFLDNFSICINIKRPDETFMISNQANTQAMTGNSSDSISIRNKTNSPYFGPEFVKKFQQEDLNVLSGKTVKAINPEGVMVIKTPLYNTQLHVVGILMISYTVTLKEENTHSLNIMREISSKADLIKALEAINAENQQQNAALAKALQSNHRIMRGSSEPIFIEDADGKIKEINQYSTEAVLGLTWGDVIEKRFVDIVAPDWQEFFKEKLAKGYLINDLEVMITKADGTNIPCKVRMQTDPETGENTFTVKDLSAERMESNTGLPMRETFETYLEFNLSHAARYQKNMALLVMDMNGLKEINDTYGHDFADAVILRIGDILKQFFNRKVDLVSRLYNKGDEFSVMLYDCQDTTILEKIMVDLLQVLTQAEISIGIGVVPLSVKEILHWDKIHIPPTKLVKMLMDRAEAAMRVAKAVAKETPIAPRWKTKSRHFSSAYAVYNQTKRHVPTSMNESAMPLLGKPRLDPNFERQFNRHPYAVIPPE